MELRIEAAHTTDNQISMSSPQQIAQAKDENERPDIKINDIADKLAKKGTGLPVQEGQPKEAWSICAGWGEAPTPSKKKRIHQLYQDKAKDAVH